MSGAPRRSGRAGGAPLVLALYVLVWTVVAAVLVVLEVVDDPTDWIVLGVLASAVPGVSLAVWHRRYPPASRKRSFRRDADSFW